MSRAGDRDALAEALGALREETAGTNPRAAETRRRILLAAGAQRRRRLVVLRIVVPLAAVLAIGTAWAAAGGRWAPVQETGGEGGSGNRAAASANANVDADADADASALTEADATADASPEANAEATAVLPRALVVPMRVDGEETVYRAAHEAHFVAKDPPRALAAWDAYLATYPRGKLAPEARYNRALTLVRLGRKDEARAALEPFAEGKPPGYRRAEARALLDAMR